jgi:hypothetical protein
VNSHDRAQELISARMDGPLRPAEQRALQEHLATCPACQIFAGHADALAHGLHDLPRLGPSPAVSRAVMSAVSAEASGWDWLRKGLHAVSSPGMAVASGLALVLVMTAALLVALNAPSGGNDAANPESTIAAVAVAPLPTEAPTEVPTAVPTEPPPPEPTATRAPQRTITDPPTEAPEPTPAPRPTATRVPIVDVARSQEPVTDVPIVESAPIDQPIIEPAAEEPVLAMAEEAPPTTDMAQTAVEPEAAPAAEPPAEESQVAAPEDDGGRRGGRKDNNDKSQVDAAAVSEAPPAEPITLPVPDEAIAALESAGTDLYLPPAPLDPLPPQQEFLPVTPTPEGGTPTPESSETQSDAPQLAEDTSGELGVTALAPINPNVVNIDEGRTKKKEKRDKSTKDGESREQQQTAYFEQPMAWSAAMIELPQMTGDETTYQADDLVDPIYIYPEDPTTTADDAPVYVEEAPVYVEEEPVYVDETTAYPDETTTYVEDPALTTDETMIAEEPRQIDPATGLEIDPATGLLIDPSTGYLLDLVNNRIIDPRTRYEVHPLTGLLVDPATGAQLDPVTLAIVIPAGFGSDTPAYVPGSDSMRGDIETVVDATYDDATYKVIPGTDGPTQPVGEITVPTESGESLEIS